jgi:hypothetical protein
LVITVVQDHDLEFLMDEEAGISSRGFKAKLGHAFAEMFIEKLGGINLSIDALVHLEHHILALKCNGFVVLGKLHVEWLVCWLWALTEGKSKVNLAGLPSVGGSQDHGSSNCREPNQRAVSNPFVVL